MGAAIRRTDPLAQGSGAQTDDLLACVIDAVGDIKKVTDFIEEDLLALLHTDVLSHDDETIGPRAFQRLIFDFGNILAYQHLVLIALETNNALFNSLGLASRSRGNFITREPLEGLPRLLGQGFCQLHHLGMGIHSENEFDSLAIPPV